MLGRIAIDTGCQPVAACSCMMRLFSPDKEK